MGLKMLSRKSSTSQKCCAAGTPGEIALAGSDQYITDDAKIPIGSCGDAWKLVSVGDPYDIVDHRPYCGGTRTPVGLCADAPLLVLYPERGAIDWPALLCLSGKELRKGYCASGAEIYTIYLTADDYSRLKSQASVTVNEIRALLAKEQGKLTLAGERDSEE